MTAASGTYAYTTNQTVQYGPGCTKTALPKLLKQFNVSRALIVCGSSLANKTDVIKQITSILGSAHAATFTEIGQHAPSEGVQNGLRKYTETGADVLISVGGGSPIDAAKAISYFSHEQTGKWIRHIAIPTTLSAAEFSSTAGFTKDGRKTSVATPEIAPDAVILDAAWSLQTPMKLWITTGIRALDHAVESLYRPYVPPFIHTLAYSAIKDLFTLLPHCQSHADDVETRQALQLAAWHSLFPYRQENEAKSALGPSHALGYMLGAPYGIAHGQCSCLTLGPVVRFQSTHAGDAQRQRLAYILNLLGHSPTQSLEKDVARVGDLIDELVVQLGHAQGMLQLGVPNEQALKTVTAGAGLKGADQADMIALLRPKL